MTTEYGNFRHNQESLVERLYDYQNPESAALDVLKKKNLIIKLGSRWLKEVLSTSTYMGVYLPSINIMENNIQVEAYYTETKNGYIYFITSNKLYYYQKLDYAIGKPLFGSTPILNAVCDKDGAEELMLEMDIYMRYRGVKGKRAKRAKKGGR